MIRKEASGPPSASGARLVGWTSTPPVVISLKPHKPSGRGEA